MITVGEALGLPSLRNARVVAGQRGLSRVITWFHIIDIPQFLPWLEGGELVLTNTYSLHVNPGVAVGLVEGLAAKGVAGMVGAMGLYLERFPENMLVSADELGFPLIEVPAELHFEEVTRELAEQIFLRKWVEAALSCSGIGGGLCRANLVADVELIAEVLNSTRQLDVAVLDDSGRLVGVSGTFGEGGEFAAVLTSAREAVREICATGDMALLGRFIGSRAGKFGQTHCWIEPVYGEREGDIIGVIVIGKRIPFSIQDFIAVKQAAVAASRALKSVRTKQVGRSSNLLCTVLPGLKPYSVDCRWFSDEDLSKLHVLMLLGVDDYDRYVVSNRLAEHEVNGFLASFYQAVKTGLVRQGKDCPIFTRDDLVLAVVPVYGESDIENLEQVVRCSNVIFGAEHKNASLSAGISSMDTGSSRILERAVEAAEALETARCVFGRGSTGYYPKLGGLRLVYKLSRDGFAQDVYKEIMARLVRYDTEHRSDLVRTLEEYVNFRGNIAKVARSLFVHRGTVLYRLQKIAELTGMDPRNPSNLPALSLLVQMGRGVTCGQDISLVCRKLLGGGSRKV